MTLIGAFLGGMSIGELAIAVVAIAAVVALVLVGIKAMGLTIPVWVQQAFWIVVIALVIIAAIKLVMSM